MVSENASWIPVQDGAWLLVPSFPHDLHSLAPRLQILRRLFPQLTPKNPPTLLPQWLSLHNETQTFASYFCDGGG